MRQGLPSVVASWLALSAGCAFAPAEPLAAPPAASAPDAPAPSPSAQPRDVVAPSASPAAPDLELAREALALLHRANSSSRLEEIEALHSEGMRQLACLGDRLVPCVDFLLRRRDPAMWTLGGTALAILAGELGAEARLAPALIDALSDADPLRRAFACEALGYLRWNDAEVHLRTMLDDDAVVPGYADDASVRVFAAHALDLIARARATRSQDKR